MNKHRSVLQAIIYGRFTLLLFFVALMFLVIPLIPADRATLSKSIDLLGLIIVLSCLRGITEKKRFFIFMIVLSVINVTIGGSALLMAANPSFQMVVIGFRLLYYLLIFFSIMKYVLDKTPITSDKIAGALSGYILIGIIWAFIYAVFFIQNPENFTFSNPTISESHNWTVYFSFTTLTTLGYGDIIPNTQAPQSYAVMEAMFGQIFLAVVIARLVALQILHNKTESNKTESNQT